MHEYLSSENLLPFVEVDQTFFAAESLVWWVAIFSQNVWHIVKASLKNKIIEFSSVQIYICLTGILYALKRILHEMEFNFDVNSLKMT